MFCNPEKTGEDGLCIMQDPSHFFPSKNMQGNVRNVVLLKYFLSFYENKNISLNSRKKSTKKLDYKSKR